jgi:DNA-binding winged helix-turn-helix (wHTH) protein
VNDQSGNDAKIDLAQEADFALGGLQVSPSACRATHEGGEERVEPRVMEVLIILVRYAGRTVTREQLIDACWDGRTVSDDAVTRVIARLRALGRSADPPHFTLETIPKVGFRLSPNGQAIANAPASVQAVPPQYVAFADKRTIAAAFAAVALLIGGIWWAIGRPPAPSRAIPDRVAIVAFATLGPEPELVTLARKAQDAAVQRLTEMGIPAATVAPGGAPSAATELRLHGSIERNGDEYAMRATLGVHPSGLALWSGRFARNPADLAGLEEEAAYTIAEGLACATKERVGALWQRANEALLPLLFEICFAGTTLDVERKVAAARRLAEAAPDLAFAHGRLALALAEQSTAFAHLPDQTKALADAALVAAKKALALDGEEVSAHLALGARTGKTSLAAREQYLKRALDLAPQDLTAILHYNKFLLEVGRTAAAREILARAERWPGTAFLRAQIDAMRGDRIGAQEQLDQLAVVRPAWARDGRFILAAFWEDPRTAIGRLPALAAARPQSGDGCIIAHVAALARTAGPQLNGLPPECENLPVDWRVRLLARQGDVERAFALLEGPWPVTRVHWFLFYPEMKSVRADPRFLALAERLHLLAYWRETNQWPDYCKEPGLQYECR